MNPPGSCLLTISQRKQHALSHGLRYGANPKGSTQLEENNKRKQPQPSLSPQKHTFMQSFTCLALDLHLWVCFIVCFSVCGIFNCIN